MGSLVLSCSKIRESASCQDPYNRRTTGTPGLRDLWDLCSEAACLGCKSSSHRGATLFPSPDINCRLRSTVNLGPLSCLYHSSPVWLPWSVPCGGFRMFVLRNERAKAQTGPVPLPQWHAGTAHALVGAALPLVTSWL